MSAVNKRLFERTPLIIAMLVFVFGCLVAGLTIYYQQKQNQIELQERFDAEAKKLANTLISHIKSYEIALLGIRGMIVSHGDDKITRSAFKSYYLSRNMDNEFSGAMGFGFIRRIARENEADFLNKARQDDMPDFTIKEFAPHEGERYIIQYIEPAGRNLAAIGLDIASENARRKAAQEAMRTGLTIMTAPITLIQTSGKPLQSFLLLLPVYHLSVSLLSAEQREAETFGWSYMPIGIDDVLNQQITDDSTQIVMQIADFSANERTVFYTHSGFEDTAKTLNIAKINQTIFGRTWQFELRALPLFYQYHKYLSLVWLASIATFCSFLLSVSLYLYLSNRQRTLNDLIEQKRLATIVECANDAIISFDLNGVITSWNRAADRLFDYSAEYAIGKKLCELIIPDEFLSDIDDFLRRIRRGEFIPLHDTIRKRRDGRLIDVSVSFSQIRDKNDKIIGTANSIIDITERKRSQELFQMTIESIPDALITVDYDNRISLSNQQALRLLGYESSELLGQNISLIIPVRYREQHLLNTQRYYLNPKARVIGQGLNLFVLCKNGQEVPVEIQLSPIQTATQKFTLASITDISQRKELQSEVQTTLARMKMAINALNIGIWVWRLDNNELIWDDRMIELYQVPESINNSRLYYDFWVCRLHPDDRKKAESLIQGCLAGENTFDTDFRIVLDTGEIRYIKASAILERDENAKLIQMVGVNFDITDIKTAEIRIMEINASLEQQVDTRTAELNQALELAKQASNAKTDFLANMSHEIRTPINAIIGLAYLLKKQELDTAVRNMVGNIDNAGHSLLNVINECLDFSKIEANQLDIEAMPFQLSDVLDSIANIMASSAVQKKSIELCIAPVPKRANYLLGDPVRMEQVLVNLVSNAIKFTEQGEIIVEVRIIDSILSKNRIYLHFSVRDTGIGIAPEKQESIFKPFMQADNSTTRLYGGTGLGLTISRRLVELMGGTLQIKSQLGVGSEFFFDLVLLVNNMSDNLPSVLPYQNILIADDNELARKIHRSMMISLGWNATIVDSSEKLLQKIVQKGIDHFDLLLLDWNMSDSDNIELLHRIRDQCVNEVCPIIIMTSPFDRIALAEQSINELVDGIICKPVTRSSLFNAVLQAKNQGSNLEKSHKPLVNNKPLLGLNLLVVDDSEINREVAYQILTDEGANIELAENGAVALILLKARPDYFHLVLMDVQMPVMDGYAATQAIREIPELSHLPIIALTAGAFKSQRDVALEMGMDDFVAKPFEVNELVACIIRLVHHRQNGKNSLLTPETTAPIQAIAFDEIPLIDVEQGLKKWRTVESYQKYLRLFLREHAQDAERIHHEYQKGDNIAAMEITHKLVGVAGALSLKCVACFAADIEQAFNNKINEELILRFVPILAQTLDAITVYLKSEVPPQIEPVNSQNMSNSVVAELEQLIESLNSNNPELIEPRLFALSGKLPKQQFDTILSAIETFDFRKAENIAKTLIAVVFNDGKE